MRFAQRGGSVNPQSQQQVEIFNDSSPYAVGLRISERVANFAVKVVAISHWECDDTYTPYGATVVFEEES
jgi:hypothetical protein